MHLEEQRMKENQRAEDEDPLKYAVKQLRKQQEDNEGGNAKKCVKGSSPRAPMLAAGGFPQTPAPQNSQPVEKVGKGSMSPRAQGILSLISRAEKILRDRHSCGLHEVEERVAAIEARGAQTKREDELERELLVALAENESLRGLLK
jgi:hypothetical protein